MLPACSVVMRDFGDPLTITIFTCERFVGKLSTVVEGKEVCNSIGTISKIQADKRMRGWVVNE